MKSFDEWFDRNDVRILVERSNARFVYEAGAQSRQAEIDELEKRIDEAIYDLQHIESAMWEEQVEHVLMILKGNQS